MAWDPFFICQIINKLRKTLANCACLVPLIRKKTHEFCYHPTTVIKRPLRLYKTVCFCFPLQTSCLIWFTNESSYLTLKYSENKLPRMPGTFHAGTISVCPFVQSNIWIFHIWEKTTTKKHSTCTDLLKLYGKIQITMFYYSAFLMRYKKNASLQLIPLSWYLSNLLHQHICQI